MSKLANHVLKIKYAKNPGLIFKGASWEVCAVQDFNLVVLPLHTRVHTGDHSRQRSDEQQINQ